jgi:HK97 family phage major capsid protein/HK97 family phage prohead protease
MMTEKERKDFEGLETRTFALEFERAEGEEDNRTMSISFASEEPVLRSFGWEILSHERGDIDFDFIGSGRAPLLLSHDPETQIGVVESASLSETERKSRAVVRFGNGSLASEIFRDVQDKIRANISVGYTITELTKQDEQREGQDVYRAKFQPKEISVVSIPADSQVGIGRAEKIKTLIESKKMETTTEIVSEPTRLDDIDFKKEVDEILAQRAKDNKEISALGVRHNMRDFADECIAKNMSLYEFRTKMLNKIESKPLEVSADHVDVKPKEKRQYSLLRALNAASRGDWSGAGFEAEMSQEVGHRQSKTPQGFFVPDYAWTGNRNEAELEKRTVMTVGTNASGGFFAPQEQLGSEFVGALRAKMVMPGLGMRIMSGLTTKLTIPKVSAGVTAAFVAEESAVAAVNQTTAQITMQGRTLGCYEDVSRLLLLESDPSIEAIVRDDILSAMADKIESVAIHGGGSNEPSGIVATSGIGSVAGGANGLAPAWATHIPPLVKEVEIDNAALNASTLGWLTNPKVKSKMASVAKVSSSDSVMILNDPWDALFGYPLAITTNVSSTLTKGNQSLSSALIFGDFSQLILGLWNTPDVLVDPYTNGAKGTIRIVVLQEVDLAVRHAQSFAACLDVLTA